MTASPREELVFWIYLARFVDQRAGSEPVRRELMEVLPPSSGIASIVLRAALRDLIECREADLGADRGGEEGPPQAVPVGPLAVRVGNDLTKGCEIAVIELGVLLRSAPPPTAGTMYRDQRLKQLDGLCRIDLRGRLLRPTSKRLTMAVLVALSFIIIKDLKGLAVKRSYCPLQLSGSKK